MFTGTGYDLPLLEWLQKYTFPREREFENEEYAKTTYPKVVARSLRCGTTTACYYATIHLPATKLLTDIIEVAGQRAFIGKVNMDRNSPDWYIETSEESLARTRNFVEFVAKKGNDLLQPVITPRFTPSCTRELMTALGQLAKEHDLLIQT